jgi:hypothetical protein
MSVLRVAVAGELDREHMPDGLRAALVRATGEASFDRLEGRLADSQARVRELFDEIVGAPEKAGEG